MKRVILPALLRPMFRSLLGFQQPLRDDLVACVVPSGDGSRLEGAWLEAKGEPRGVVVLCHPFLKYGLHYYVRNGLADALAGAGFHVVLFNFKGFGRSEFAGLAFHDDVLGAIAFARRRSPGLPVHVLGSSFGGFHAVHALARSDGAAQHAVIDSTPLRATDFFRAGPVARAFRVASGSAWGKRYGAGSILEDIPRIQRTSLHFIYGEADAICSAADRLELGRLIAPDQVTLLRGAGHLDGFKRDPERYERILRERLSR